MSDCYVGRIVIDEVKEILRFEKRNELILVYKNQEIFVACNCPNSG